MAVSEVTDPEGMRIRTYTDVRGNQVGVERAGRAGETAVTAYAYDPLGQLVQIRDPSQATTSIAYDLLGRQVRVDAPDTGRMDVGYNLASNVVSRVTPTLRAAGQQITYEGRRRDGRAQAPSRRVAGLPPPPGADSAPDRHQGMS